MEGSRQLETTVWRPKSQQNAKALRSFGDTMDDIRDVLEFRSDVSVSVDYIRNAGRRVSVELRKLLLDSAPLVHRVLEKPRFLPLRESVGLMGDVYENSFTMRIALGTEDGPSLGQIAEHTWELTVHPLHGLRFGSRPKHWIVEPLFDEEVPPMTLETWLRQRLFRVDQRVYSLRETLKFVTNKEAVHVDIDRDELSRDMERVHFGYTTYPHMVAFLVASYVLEQYRASRTEHAELWSRFHGMRSAPIPEYKIISGCNFEGPDIFPPGFPEEFHETGILVPEAGKVCEPAQIREHTTVRP